MFFKNQKYFKKELKLNKFKKVKNNQNLKY